MSGTHFAHLMETLNGLRDSGDNRGKISGTRQPNVEKCLLVRVEDTLNTLYARRLGDTVEGKTVTCNFVNKTAETIRCKQLA